MGTTSVPDLIHNYEVDAVTTEVNYTNKNFMLIGNEQQFKNDNSEMTLVETGDSTIAKDYTTPLTFKYEGGEQ
jgi:actin-related protein